MSAARAHLSAGRIGDDLDRLSTLRARLGEAFAQAGAATVEPETLQPADVMLDLYGEDVRARAYLLQDPVVGELCLRPDFTVPVARVHMSDGCDPARYAYHGLVWRRQEPGSDRPSEYLQAGFELIGGADPAADDAEVFTLIQNALGPVAQKVITGDLSILFAAIDALETTEARRAVLRRHVWRPKRFQDLLSRFVSPPTPSADRAALLAADETRRKRMISGAGRFVGMRSEAEILARANALAEDAALPPLSVEQKAVIDAVIATTGPSGRALTALRDLGLPAMSPALDRMEKRLASLEAYGVDAAALPFDAAFGRSLEYYDGFVFEFRGADDALPPLGGGGRYDTLTTILGQGEGSTAVGGMVRPEAMIAAGWTA
ncbi:MAG: ATP phosphoribosyltransferase regulatory subunit [Pikeienuella sp.]